MPFLLLLKRIPWQAWAALGALIFIVWLRSHWIGVGYDKCMEANRKAQEAAAIEAKKQEEAAPVIAMEAMEIVRPKMEKRENEIAAANTIACDVEYPDGVQQAIREAASSADPMRPDGSSERTEADDQERTEAN